MEYSITIGQLLTWIFVCLTVGWLLGWYSHDDANKNG